MPELKGGQFMQVGDIVSWMCSSQTFYGVILKTKEHYHKSRRQHYVHFMNPIFHDDWLQEKELGLGEMEQASPRRLEQASLYMERAQ